MDIPRRQCIFPDEKEEIVKIGINITAFKNYSRCQIRFPLNFGIGINFVCPLLQRGMHAGMQSRRDFQKVWLSTLLLSTIQKTLEGFNDLQPTRPYLPLK